MSLVITDIEGNSYVVSRECLAPSEFFAAVPLDEVRVKPSQIPVELLAFAINLLRFACGSQSVPPPSVEVLHQPHLVTTYVFGYLGILSLPTLLARLLQFYAAADNHLAVATILTYLRSLPVQQFPVAELVRVPLVAIDGYVHETLRALCESLLEGVAPRMDEALRNLLVDADDTTSRVIQTLIRYPRAYESYIASDYDYTARFQFSLVSLFTNDDTDSEVVFQRIPWRDVIDGDTLRVFYLLEEVNSNPPVE